MNTAHPEAAQNSGAGPKPGVTRIVDLLVSPISSDRRPEDRQQARVLATLLLALGFLTGLWVILPPLLGYQNMLQDPLMLVLGGSGLALLAAYGLSRTNRYLLGAVLAILLLEALPFAYLLTRTEIEPALVPLILGWLLLALLFCGIFFKHWGVLLLTLVSVTALLLLPDFVPVVTSRGLFPVITLLVVSGLLLAISAANRKAIERFRMADLSDKDKEMKSLRDSLEQRVQSRTRDLGKQLNQMQIAAEISRSISGVLKVDDLLKQVVNRLVEAYSLYYAGVFLIDRESGYAVLHSGSGDPGKKLVTEGFRLAVGGSSLVGWATAQLQPRIGLDLGPEAVQFNYPHLPLTRSEAVLPLVYADEVLGAVTIQSSDPSAFDEDDLAIFQGIVDSLATAIINAHHFSRVEASLQETEALQANYLSQAWAGMNPGTWEFSLAGEMDGPARRESLTSLEVPLTLREQVIGQLILEADKGGWSAEETAFIEAITTQAAIALENARLLEESQHRAKRERIISDIANKLWRSPDVDTILQTSIRELGKVLNAAEGFIQLEVEE